MNFIKMMSCLEKYKKTVLYMTDEQFALLKNVKSDAKRTQIAEKPEIDLIAPNNFYKKFIPEEVKKSSPLDFNKEQALEYLKNLPKCLHNGFFPRELRKKWGLSNAK